MWGKRNSIRVQSEDNVKKNPHFCLRWSLYDNSVSSSKVLYQLKPPIMICNLLLHLFCYIDISILKLLETEIGIGVACESKLSGIEHMNLHGHFAVQRDPVVKLCVDYLYWFAHFWLQELASNWKKNVPSANSAAHASPSGQTNKAIKQGNFVLLIL